MQIEIFSLCDAATAEAGKFNILGAFDTIWVKDVPTIHPQCAVAFRARFERVERGEHKIIVSFADEDGKSIIPPMQGTIPINFPEEQGSVSANLILNLQGLKIEKTGRYSIDLAIDGRREVSLPLYVKKK